MIAQLIFLKKEEVDFVPVEELMIIQKVLIQQE